MCISKVAIEAENAALRLSHDALRFAHAALLERREHELEQASSMHAMREAAERHCGQSILGVSISRERASLSLSDRGDPHRSLAGRDPTQVSNFLEERGVIS